MFLYFVYHLIEGSQQYDYSEKTNWNGLQKSHFIILPPPNDSGHRFEDSASDT